MRSHISLVWRCCVPFVLTISLGCLGEMPGPDEQTGASGADEDDSEPASEDAPSPGSAADDVDDPATPPAVGDDTPPTAGVGCGSPAPAAGAWTLEHDGVTRRFHVRLPPGFDNQTPTPIVFSFHGRAVTASQQEAASGFTALAADEGFVVVYPEGLGTVPSWNAGFCCGDAQQSNVDDTGFFDAMLARLSTDLCIDSDRVYANGLSAGGFMTYALACERSDKLAAVASVAGVTTVFPCEAERPVPVLHFHGTADNIVPYNGNAGLSALSAGENAASWASRDSCTVGPIVDLQIDDVTCETWSECAEGAEVRLCTIEGGGHQWPGGMTIPLLGSNTDAISATEMMWSFFAAHHR